MMIQKRDREILRRCYEQQFLLMEHVQRTFFRGCNRSKAYERIDELEDVGWVRKERIAGVSRTQLIRLTPEGARLARGLSGSDITQRRRLDLNTLEHDALVTSVALRLIELWDGTWIPEGAIERGQFPHVPDGVFVFASGKRVAIELENSSKGRTRFMRILSRWREVEILAVLFVATTPELQDELRKFISEGPRGMPFGVVALQELEAGTPPAWSTRGNLDLFRRRTF